MSMLAGPKRKKQYVLNPRGKPLYNDDDRFGSKMLQKMGWTKGKGLGAKESGSIDFVRVNFKCDAAGLGFEDRDDQWTQHQKGFNGFLETLHAKNGKETGSNEEDSASRSSGDEELGTTFGFGFSKTETKTKTKVKKLTENISGQSLEERSKQSRARVHYKKYTRGKDLAQYSEKDLANIFGKKVNDIGEVEERSASDDSGSVEAEVDEIKEEVANAAEDSVMLKTSTTSIDDYFKLKMQQKKAAKQQINGDVKSMTVVQNAASEDDKSTVGAYERTKKKRKSKHDEQQNEAEVLDSANGLEQADVVEPKKKKKKQKTSKDDLVTFEPLESETVNSVMPETITESKKKKKKQKSSNEDLAASETHDSLAYETQQPQTEIKQKKKKQKSCNENFVPTESKTEEPAAIEKNIKSKKVKIIGDDGIVTSDNKKKKKTPKDTNEHPSTTQHIELPLTAESNSNSRTGKVAESNSKFSEKAKTTEESVRFSSTKTVSDANSITNMEEFTKFYSNYQISTFVAEKFRHLDFKKFKNSNLAQLIGYSHDENLKIEIIPNATDEFRILELWKHSFDKYSDSKLIKEDTKNAAKNSEATKTKNNEVTQPTKKKIKQKKYSHKNKLQNLKRLKRRSVFKLGI